MNQIIDETGLMTSSGRLMEKPEQDQAVVLKCPRCDSSNTKFCYYNNYSLSQPRHFCKACKRYWTRGGTLRNVPVGGGCRKNKRFKKPAASTYASHSIPTPTPSNSLPQIDASLASKNINPLFYDIPSNPSDIDLPFPMFNSRASNLGYDLQPQFNALNLGFSSAMARTSDAHVDGYQTRFNPTTQIQDVVTSNSLLSNYSLFGSSSSTSTSPTRASLIASSLQHQKLILGSFKERQQTSHFQALVPFDGLQMARNGGVAMGMRDVKMEERNIRMNNNMEWNVTFQSPIEPIALSDPSIYNCNTQTVGANWPDLTNFGSSIT
ncbi:hypothetical protein HHK36_001846 [Tetracentron sinense]|uniref:Dof zinc finger protein n=1 Tax=Tetracentron sinense TaxID=13715 RepID=A0A835DVE8_TETSI|nr:hypothetical protein HHK36_001846 [Tetracentron sinense]